MIVSVGSLNVDHIIHNWRLPRLGETIYGKNVTIMAGGKGANQMAAAARLGSKTVLISKVGGLDQYNSLIFNDMKWAGIDTSCIEQVDDIYTGSGYILVMDDSKNSIIIIEGANKYITPEYVEKHKDKINYANLCSTEFMIPNDTFEYTVKLAKKNGIPTLVNPSPSRPISEEIYKYIDIIMPNEVEASDYCGFKVDDEKSAMESCNFFHSKGVKNVVITMGSQGSFISDGERSIKIGCDKVDVIDSSGAGDSFNGGFSFAFDHGYDIFESAKFGNAVATRSVMRVGTMRSMPTRDEAEEYYKLPTK